MKKGNLDKRTLEPWESEVKEKKRRNKIAVALLMANLAIGFCTGMGAMYERKASELTAATTIVFIFYNWHIGK